jgi:hypothetical protein
MSNSNSNSSKSILKVLIVVDVQNCFIAGGSYGGHEKNSIDGNKLANSINQIMEISNLIDSNDSIILTRDYHPINHLSIAVKNRVTLNYDATHPSHCLNTKSNACPRNKNLRLTNKEINNIKSRNYISIEDYLEEKFNIIKFKNNNKYNKNNLKEVFLEIPKELYNQKIIGTNLSWLYSITDYATIISELIKKNEQIGIKSTNKSTEPKYSNITIPKSYKVRGKEFIQLVKGQLCSYESYSAFNYHWELGKSNNKAKNGLVKYTSKYITSRYKDEKDKDLKDLSTGLFEYILKTTKKNIEITICGLVGEICVINSITEGLIMWNLLYKELFPKKSVTFNYSLYGTLFSGLGLHEFDKDPIQPYKIFFNIMKNFLNNVDKEGKSIKNGKEINNVHNDYKKYINFNVLDYNNKYCGKFFYNETNNEIDYEIDYETNIKFN